MKARANNWKCWVVSQFINQKGDSKKVSFAKVCSWASSSSVSLKSKTGRIWKRLTSQRQVYGYVFVFFSRMFWDNGNTYTNIISFSAKHILYHSPILFNTSKIFRPRSYRCDLSPCEHALRRTALYLEFAQNIWIGSFNNFNIHSNSWKNT